HCFCCADAYEISLPSLCTTRCPPPCFTLFPYTTLFRSGPEIVPSRRIRSIDVRAWIDKPCVTIRPILEAQYIIVGMVTHGLSIQDRKSTRLNSSHEWISYAVFCLKKKNKRT